MFRSNERGSAIQAIIFSALVLVVTVVTIGIRTLRSQFAGRQLRDDAAQVQLNSAVETTLLIFRLAEIKYIDTVKDCDTAKPFLRALKEGSGCAGTTTELFSGSDEGTADGVYTYSGAGCAINASNSTCGSANRLKLFQIGAGGPETKLNGSSFVVYLVAVNVPKQVIELLVEVTTSDKRVFKNQFALRSTAANFAHLEGDGRVTQEHPDPLSKCTGAEWAEYSVYNAGTRRCEKFSQLGSGTGLAFFTGRYFGFRPADGQVVDLLAGGSASSYMVAEDGTIGGTQVFPAYSKEMLTNVDDITVADDQVHFVAGMGEDARISLLKRDGDGNFDRVTVCPLGQLGWAQAYTGVAAMGWNEPLYPLPTADDLTRIGMYLLKTDAGDLLTAVVQARKTGYTCQVFKEQALQQIEYSRSLGFDRVDDALPFFIY